MDVVGTPESREIRVRKEVKRLDKGAVVAFSESFLWAVPEQPLNEIGGGHAFSKGPFAYQVVTHVLVDADCGLEPLGSSLVLGSAVSSMLLWKVDDSAAVSREEDD